MAMASKCSTPSVKAEVEDVSIAQSGSLAISESKADVRNQKEKKKKKKKKNDNLKSLLREISSIGCKSELCSALHHTKMKRMEASQRSPMFEQVSSQHRDELKLEVHDELIATIVANFAACEKKLGPKGERDQSKGHGPVFQIIRGPTGVGKTGLVCRFIETVNVGPEPYSYIAWIEAMSQCHLAQSWRQLASQRGILPAISSAPPATFAPMLQNHLTNIRGRWLLIIDSASQLDMMTSSTCHLPIAGCHCHVLVTTNDLSGQVAMPGPGFHLAEDITIPHWTADQLKRLVAHQLTMSSSPEVAPNHPDPVRCRSADSHTGYVEECRQPAGSQEDIQTIASLSHGNLHCSATLCQSLRMAKSSTARLRLSKRMRGLLQVERDRDSSATCAGLASQCGHGSCHCPCPDAMQIVWANLPRPALDLLGLLSALGGQKVPVALLLLTPTVELITETVSVTVREMPSGRQHSPTDRQCSPKQIRRDLKKLIYWLSELEALKLVTVQRPGAYGDFGDVSLPYSMRGVILCSLDRHSSTSLHSSLECAVATASQIVQTCCRSTKCFQLTALDGLIVRNISGLLPSSRVASTCGPVDSTLQSLSDEAQRTLCVVGIMAISIGEMSDSVNKDERFKSMLSVNHFMEQAKLQVREAGDTLTRMERRLLQQQRSSERTAQAELLMGRIHQGMLKTLLAPMLKFGAQRMKKQFELRSHERPGLSRRRSDLSHMLCLPSFSYHEMSHDDVITDAHLHTRVVTIFQDAIAGFLLLLDVLEKQAGSGLVQNPQSMTRTLSVFRAQSEKMCAESMDTMVTLQQALNPCHDVLLCPLKRRRKGKQSGRSCHSPPTTTHDWRHGESHDNGQDPETANSKCRCQTISMEQRLARMAYTNATGPAVVDITMGVASLLALRALMFMCFKQRGDFHRTWERAMIVSRQCGDRSMTAELPMLLRMARKVGCGAMAELLLLPSDDLD